MTGTDLEIIDTDAHGDITVQAIHTLSGLISLARPEGFEPPTPKFIVWAR